MGRFIVQLYLTHLMKGTSSTYNNQVVGFVRIDVFPAVSNFVQHMEYIFTSMSFVRHNNWDSRTFLQALTHNSSVSLCKSLRTLYKKQLIVIISKIQFAITLSLTIKCLYLFDTKSRKHYLSSSLLIWCLTFSPNWIRLSQTD